MLSSIQLPTHNRNLYVFKYIYFGILKYTEIIFFMRVSIGIFEFFSSPT